MQLFSWIKIFKNWIPRLRRGMGATEYKTQNLVQIFCMINALKILR